MKYYAVHTGKVRGVFTTWKECQDSVEGYPRAKFKSFATQKKAEYFVKHGAELKPASVNKDNKKANKTIVEKNNEATVYVDGSYNIKTEVYGSGSLFIFKEKIVNLVSSGDKPQFKVSRNVAGEIFAVINAIYYAKSSNVKELNIFYDYEGIEKWAKGEWATSSPIAEYYLNELLKTKIKLHFHKVKAHSNDTLNDCADLLAKKAAGVGQKAVCEPNEGYKKI